MPAIESEIQEAEAEGIRFEFLALPERIEGRGGRVQKLICRRMKLGGYSLDGRRRPDPTDELFELEVDTVIAAIGQKPNTEGIADLAGMPMGKSGRISVDWFSNETGIPAVYAGGDVVTGPSIVLTAIEAGERAAVAINEKLSEDVPPKERSQPFWRRDLENDTAFDPEAEPVELGRAVQEKLPLPERLSFEEVELKVPKKVIVEECTRCLRCDFHVEE
jgi:hypothetical protein